MKIQNKTAWLTRDLKRIFCETLRRNERIEGKRCQYYKRHLLVVVVYARISLNAMARINGAWIKVWMDPEANEFIPELAQIFEHELQHNRGYCHKSMLPWNINNTGYEWAADNKRFPLRKQERN